MATIETGAQAPGQNLWRDEIRATVSLAWPMVLTNLGQTAMHTTDVMMMGRLSADTLAAGALGVNLFFAPLIFGVVLDLAGGNKSLTAWGLAFASIGIFGALSPLARWLYGRREPRG